MTLYAQLKEDGSLEYAPRNQPGISNWIENTEAVIAAGYLPVEKIPQPNDGKQYTLSFAKKDGKIVYCWTEIPQPILTYADFRRQAYPPLEEQLDMIYWDKINDTNNWEKLITEIKNAYPKTEIDINEGAENV